MSSSIGNDSGADRAEEEMAGLRADVLRLELQLAEVEAWANRAVAEAQAKTYWLDRWGVDLNALMEHPAADRARVWARRLRFVYRLAVRWKRRLVS